VPLLESGHRKETTTSGHLVHIRNILRLCRFSAARTHISYKRRARPPGGNTGEEKGKV
jgi:hypothetical protein